MVRLSTGSSRRRRGERRRESDNISWEIVNAVATGVADTFLDLDDISKKIEGTSYNPRRFPGATIRISNPKTSFLLFNSGKIVAVGMKDLDTVRERFDILQDMLSNVGISITINDCRIVNSVATMKVGRWIDLNNLYMMLLEDDNVCPQFDLEIYPSLYATIGNCTVIAATRHTSSEKGVTSFNILGGTCVNDINDTVNTLMMILDRGGFI